MIVDLAQYRNIRIDDATPSKALLYWYSRYQKEREEAAQKAANARR
jgi:hypothetical protein